MKIAAVILTVMLSGCSVYGGVSMHTYDADCPEYCGNNPMGHFGARYHADDDLVLFVDHISSIPDIELGKGLNRIGVEKSIRIFE